MLSFFIQLCTFISTLRSVNCEIPGEGETSVNWIQLKSLDGIRFSARNGALDCLVYFEVMLLELLFFYVFSLCVAFAATVFKGEIWLTGGRSDLYNMYNMQFSFKNADVWHSADGSEFLCS